MSLALAAALLVVQEAGQDFQTVWVNCDYTLTPSFVAVCDGYEQEPADPFEIGTLLERVTIEGRHGAVYATTCLIREQGSTAFLYCGGLLSDGFE